MVHGYQRIAEGPEPSEVPGMLAHLGLLEEQAWWLKWRVVCQLCGFHAALLVLDPATTRWGCHRCCVPVIGFRLERTLAEIAFAGRIGLVDQHVGRRQRWAMRELGELARIAATPRALVVLAVGTALLQRRRPWLRRASGSGGGLRQGRGPLWRRLSPEFAWAFADSVLAREAYRQRWGLPALFGVIDTQG
ncbi:MAG TPA: hypothetical protein VN961_15335 [Streptosporangiaceae bacterium]|nr:hypothetical protein [Streptosporangiaceae bacterium]